MLASKKNRYLLFMFKPKLFNIEHQGSDLLNQRNGSDRCAKSIHVWSFFLVQSFSRSWTEYGELKSKNFFSKCDQIRKKLRIRSHLLKKLLMKNFSFRQWNQPGIGTLFAHWTSEHCHVILIRLCCKFTVKSWLSDCEDMTLVVPTHFALFH